MSNQRLLVSVCIPTFNGAQFIRECLNSVLAQSFTDFEVLAVDDCSTDATAQILDEYRERDSRVRVVRNDRNLGLVANWNRCVELATGRFIKFAFQDDVLFPNCLTCLLELAENCGKPIAFCGRELLFTGSIDEAIRDEYERHPTLERLFGRGGEVSAKEIASVAADHPVNFFGEPTTALLERRLFREFGPFNVWLVHHADIDYWVRVGIHTGIVFTSENLAAFRLHPSSTSSGNRARLFRADLLDELIAMHEYAYNPHYEPLRQVLQADSRNPRKELAAKAEWLRAFALRAAADGDHGPLLEWNEAVAAFPRIRWTLYHVPIRVRALLERHLSWRLRSKDPAGGH